MLPFCASREVWSVQYRSNGSPVKKSSTAAHSAISHVIVTFRPFINQRDQLCNEHVQRISTSPTDIVYQVMVALLCMLSQEGNKHIPPAWVSVLVLPTYIWVLGGHTLHVLQKTRTQKERCFEMTPSRSGETSW